LFPPGVWNRKAETYLAGETSADGLSGRRLTVYEAVKTADKPLTAPEIAKRCGLETCKKELAQLVKSGHLTVQQQFQQAVKEKKINMVRLAQPLEQALGQIGKGAMKEKRENVLRVIHQAGQLPE
jgi:hypothetical protein